MWGGGSDLELIILTHRCLTELLVDTLFRNGENRSQYKWYHLAEASWATGAGL